MMTTPLPCPFCGEPPEYSPRVESPHWPESVECYQCWIAFRTGEHGVADAVEKWNTRKGESNPPTHPKPGDTWGAYRFHEDGWWRLENTRRGDELLRHVWNHMHGQNMDGSDKDE